MLDAGSCSWSLVWTANSKINIFWRWISRSVSLAEIRMVIHGYSRVATDNIFFVISGGLIFFAVNCAIHCAKPGNINQFHSDHNTSLSSAYSLSTSKWPCELTINARKFRSIHGQYAYHCDLRNEKLARQVNLAKNLNSRTSINIFRSKPPKAINPRRKFSLSQSTRFSILRTSIG